MKLNNLQKELLNLLQIWVVTMVIVWGVDPKLSFEARLTATITSFIVWFFRMLLSDK